MRRERDSIIAQRNVLDQLQVSLLMPLEFSRCLIRDFEAKQAPQAGGGRLGEGDDMAIALLACKAADQIDGAGQNVAVAVPGPNAGTLELHEVAEEAHAHRRNRLVVVVAERVGGEVVVIVELVLRRHPDFLEVADATDGGDVHHFNLRGDQFEVDELRVDDGFGVTDCLGVTHFG